MSGIMRLPRLIISGLSGGSGKTMVSLGLARAFRQQGLSVKTFKKGPDYIDAAWLALAAGTPQGTLDPFFSPPEQLRQLARAGGAGHDLTVIEGNRGLFDGLDIEGSCSTASLARILHTPVILVVDCTKMTRTVAALVAGCVAFDPGIAIGGVILNRTGNPRHEAMVRRAVEELAGVPVLGTLPRRATPFIPERHMGLTGADEHAADTLLDGLAGFLFAHVDLAAARALAESAPDMATLPGVSIPRTSAGISPDASQGMEAASVRVPGRTRTPRIGYVRDAALWFYYQENLDALRAAGASLTELSVLSPERWPSLDGLYLGGGLPELYAQSFNVVRREEVRRMCLAGLPTYAECGGFIYLARELRLDAGVFPMAGVFPLAVQDCPRPQGLGYTDVETVGENPFHPVGSRFHGHEFHFTRCLPMADAPLPAFRLHKGAGMGTQGDATVGVTAVDGLVMNNTFACYTHIYAPAVPHWAAAFVRLCLGNR